MPNNSHIDKYFNKLLIGFAFLTGSVLVTFYAIFETLKGSNWYLWATGAAILLCAGIYFCLSAFVHKIKSDFSRRQKQREQQKTFTADS
jgi:hypothetical protein